MRRFATIIESPTPPPTNSIWVDKGVLKYFYNGEWCTFTNIDNTPITKPNDSVNTEFKLIKLGNDIADKEYNIEVLESISTKDVITIKVEGKYDNINYNTFGLYYNGEISILEGSKCTIFDIDFYTGKVLLIDKYKLDSCIRYTELKVGNSSEIKSFNLEQIKSTDFICKVGSYYGPAHINEDKSGIATIYKSSSIDYYKIKSDGTVELDYISGDIYSLYKDAGGTATVEQFAAELLMLIGH